MFTCLLAQRDYDPIYNEEYERYEDVFSFPNERSLIMAWKAVRIVFDHDVETGWNMVNFDGHYMSQRPKGIDGDKGIQPPPSQQDQSKRYFVPTGVASSDISHSTRFRNRYMSDRARVVSLDERFNRGLGRVYDHYARIVKKTFSSKALGTVASNYAEIKGVVQFDMM